MSAKAARQQRLRYLLLTSEPATAAELQQQMEVTQLTIYRDLREINAVQVAENRYTFHPTPEDVRMAKAVLSRAKTLLEQAVAHQQYLDELTSELND